MTADTPAALRAVDRCPACGGGQRERGFTSHDWIHCLPGEFALVRCGSCRSLYPDPRPSDEALAGYYPEDDYYAYAPPSRYRLFARRGAAAGLWYATVRGVLRRHGYVHLGGSALLGSTAGRLPGVSRRATFSLGMLLHPWQANGALLDVGCGTGRYLDLMRALGWSRVVGVDTGATAVRQAQEALGLEVHCGDIRDLALPARSFDAVSMAHALEHVDDPAAVLAEVRRVLKPSGRVAIVVPNVASLMSRLLREHWLGLETPRHLVNFTPAGLGAAIERSGLSVTSLSTSPRDAYRVALFSISRARGDPRATYTDDQHSFAWHRRAAAAALAGVERGLCAARAPAGELICAVARP